MPPVLPGVSGHLEQRMVAHLTMKLMLFVEMMYGFSRDESRNLIGSPAKAFEKSMWGLLLTSTGFGSGLCRDLQIHECHMADPSERGRRRVRTQNHDSLDPVSNLNASISSNLYWLPTLGRKIQSWTISRARINFRTTKSVLFYHHTC